MYWLTRNCSTWGSLLPRISVARTILNGQGPYWKVYLLFPLCILPLRSRNLNVQDRYFALDLSLAIQFPQMELSDGHQLLLHGLKDIFGEKGTFPLSQLWGKPEKIKHFRLPWVCELFSFLFYFLEYLKGHSSTRARWACLAFLLVFFIQIPKW